MPALTALASGNIYVVDLSAVASNSLSLNFLTSSVPRSSDGNLACFPCWHWASEIACNNSMVILSEVCQCLLCRQPGVWLGQGNASETVRIMEFDLFIPGLRMSDRGEVIALWLTCFPSGMGS